MSGSGAGAGAGAISSGSKGNTRVPATEHFFSRPSALPPWGLPPGRVVIYPKGDADAVREDEVVLLRFCVSGISKRAKALKLIFFQPRRLG